MNDPKNLHQSAMAFLQEALVARHMGDEAGAISRLRAAMEAESSAAMALEMDIENEPTRSILFRSAASLAMDCGEYDAAKSLVYKALMGKVPEGVAQELQQIWDDAIIKLASDNFAGEMHSTALSSERIVLSETELDQLFQIMGGLSDAEKSVLRKEHSLIERLMNAMATFLLHRSKSQQLRGGEFPIPG